MTEYSSKTLRAAMKAKAARLASGSDDTKVDSSTFTPAEPLNADVQTGARPLTRRRFKSGGKVVGAANAQRADKKKRGNSPISSDSFINRNVVEANEEREGKKHIGAFKRGGKIDFSKIIQNKKTGKLSEKPESGRTKKEDGGGLRSERTQYEKARRNSVDEGINYRSDSQHNDESLGKAVRGYENAAKETGYSNLKTGGKANCSSSGMKKGGRTKKAGGGAKQVEKTLRDAEDANRNMQSMGSSSGSMGQTMGQASPSMGMGQASPSMGMDQSGEIGSRMKKGGRAKKFMGGPMMQPGGSMQPMGGMMKPEPNKDNPADMVDKNRFNFGTGAQGSPYKKGGKVAFEGSAKDTMQDTKLAKKYGLSMAAWEKSKQDKKHDEQESMTGLKKGGAVKHSDVAADKALIKKMVKPSARTGKDRGGEAQYMGNLAAESYTPSGPMSKEGQLMGSSHDSSDDKAQMLSGMKKGGRAKRASGGKTGKGKTNIEIVIATGKGQPQGGMMPNNGGMPPKQPPAMPVQAAPAAGLPPMAGAGGPPPQMPAGGPPQMPAGLEKLMQRKAGGRVYKSYKDMDAGSGSGLGRLEKTEIAKRTAHKHGGKAYKSYKDMDAGAASGKGRLEKAEIAARGR